MATKPGLWHQGAALRELIGEGTAPMQSAATSLGIAYQSVYRWTGRKKLPAHAIQDIIDVFGCSREWLTTGTGDRFAAAGGVSKGEKVAERLLLVYQAEVARLSARLMKDIVHALGKD